MNKFTYIDGTCSYELDYDKTLHSFNDEPSYVIGRVSMWHKHNNLHRVNGPAMVVENDYELWFLNGLLHREDLPAEIVSNGQKYWYIQDREVYPYMVCKLWKLLNE